MADQHFSIAGLMDLLVQKVGLDSAFVTDDASATLDDVGLDSLAFLQLRTELDNEYGVELANEPKGLTFGEIVAAVDEHLREKAA